MNNIFTLMLAVFSFFLSDCKWFGVRGNGKVTTDQRPITEFAEIDASGMFEIEWRGGPPALSITTDENLLSYIESRVSENKLRLHTRERVLPTHGLKVVVSSPTRMGSKLRGASELTVRQLTGPSYAVETAGAAEVTLDGTVDFLVADMTGASELKAKSLQTKTAEISTTGAAEAEVSASETLRVTITGAGEVSYHGTPKTIEKHVTGAGEIKHKD
jgi:Putative auto-transporter adhesin, head GIN domain